MRDFRLGLDSNIMGVRIVLNSWCALSPRVQTVEEANAEIDRLKAELEELRAPMVEAVGKM
jgi:hypothetical protein